MLTMIEKFFRLLSLFCFCWIIPGLLLQDGMMVYMVVIKDHWNWDLWQFVILGFCTQIVSVILSSLCRFMAEYVRLTRDYDPYEVR